MRIKASSRLADLTPRGERGPTRFQQVAMYRMNAAALRGRNARRVGKPGDINAKVVYF